MPLVLDDSISTFRNTFPVFQSRRYAASLTCSATQSPSSLDSRPFGWPSGDLNKGSILPLRTGWLGPAKALAVNPSNSSLRVSMSAPLPLWLTFLACVFAVNRREDASPLIFEFSPVCG